MKIEEAWPLMRAGARIRSQHWDELMFIVLQEGYPDGISINENTAKATGIPPGTVKKFRPYVMLHTHDGSFVPYVATQSDLLTELWEVVGPVSNPVVVGYNFEDPGVKHSAPNIHVNRCDGGIDEEGRCNC